MIRIGFLVLAVAVLVLSAPEADLMKGGVPVIIISSRAIPKITIPASTLGTSTSIPLIVPPIMSLSSQSKEPTTKIL